MIINQTPDSNYTTFILLSISIMSFPLIEVALKQSRKIVSFLSKDDTKNFGYKRQISKSVFDSLSSYYEKEDEKVIPKSKRSKNRRVYFPDDKTLPINEQSSIVTETYYHYVNEEEYKEIITYKHCSTNIDYINGRRRRDYDRQKIILLHCI